MIYLPCIEILSNPALVPTASVIWLHGLGASSDDFVSVVPELQLPESLCVRFIFPQAPDAPVTINGGYIMPSWYDILEANIYRKVDAKQLTVSANAVIALVEREISRGVISERIILAGFSQGGAVVYHAALGGSIPLGGLMALSTYFATYSMIEFNKVNKNLPILIQHGSEDPVVDEMLGQRAYRQLIDLGYPVKYESYFMEHSVCAEQIEAISTWLQVQLRA